MLAQTLEIEGGECCPDAMQEFIDRLNVTPGAKDLDFLLAELERFRPSREELKRWIAFDRQCYARNSIYRNEDFEALVITWRSGQRSPIHNHKGSACAIYVVDGTASEILFERSDHGSLYPARTEHYTAGTVCGSFDEDVHQIVNLQAAHKDLVSLHVYSPPLKGMELFSLSQSTFADYDDILIRSAKRAAA